MAHLDFTFFFPPKSTRGSTTRSSPTHPVPVPTLLAEPRVGGGRGPRGGVGMGPTGSLRWKRPAAAGGWPGGRDGGAQRFGPALDAAVTAFCRSG